MRRIALIGSLRDLTMIDLFIKLKVIGGLIVISYTSILRFSLLSLVAMTATLASAQDIGELTLEDLLNVKTAVATKKALSTREAPGVVTIITADEIRDMGARDLIDVLRLVPGIEFGYDVQGAVGMSMRGLWAHEGKFSLIVDGQEMNETLYSTTQFGNHIPVNQIARIEIIRGPGSAIYGGYAELAVVNITTKRGADLNGSQASVYAGQMVDNVGHTNITASFGKVYGEWDISLHAGVLKGIRGEGEYTGYSDFDSSTTIDPGEFGTFDYDDANDTDNTWLNFGAKKDKLDIRLIYDQYHLTTKTMYNFTGVDKAFDNDFNSILFGIKNTYEFQGWAVTPYLNFRRQMPWIQTDLEQDSLQVPIQRFEIQADRTILGVNAQSDVTDRVNLLLGAEYYQDKATAKEWYDGGDLTFSENGKRSVDYTNAAVLGQLLYNGDAFDITFGARYDDHSKVESSFVPRLGITKAEPTWHAKLLVSEAFRSPSIFNIDANADIKPENTFTTELEYGFTTSAKSYLTANIFSTRIEDPIVYGTVASTDAYFNFDKTGTDGVELDYRYKDTWGDLQIGYAYYQEAENKIATYEVPDEKALLGVPQHRGVVNSTIYLAGKNVKLNPSLIYIGEKYAYEFNTTTLVEELTKYDGSFLANVFITWEDIFTKGLAAGAGVYNLFDEENRFIQPYAGGHGSIPDASREIVVRLDYSKSY